jgi:hypothetical protein
MQPPPTPTSKRLPLRAADLRGLSRLASDATVGVVDLVESMHHTIVRGSGIIGRGPVGPAPGLTGLIYRAVRGGTRLTARGVDAAFDVAQRLWPGADGPPPGHPVREATLAVLNGVWGDHLEASGNPLAIATCLRSQGQTIELDRAALAARFPQAGGRIVVLAHGLCMNDLQWMRDGHDHGQSLARDLGATALYLHYNSGRHVSQNGRDLALLLEQLVSQWPAPVTDLLIVGHSMGGLVARSACHLAAELHMSWTRRLKALVFLGTPHHGAPLERGGQLVDRLLGVSPYVAPFARLGKARSAGITDLRYGNLHDADWQGRDRHAQRHDDRQPVPLPAGVPVYLVAATTAEHPTSLRSRMLGDGLVRLPSALGQHRNPAQHLTVPESRQAVITGASHWDLLSRRDVYQRLRDWLLDGIEPKALGVKPPNDAAGTVPPTAG